MKNAALIFIISIILPLFSNCSDDTHETETLTLSVENLNFSDIGGKQNFNITSNTKWKIEKKDTDTWYTITPSSGEGNQEITIEAKGNLETKDLESILHVKTDTKTATVSIKQEAIILYHPLVTITTENGAPIDSKETYINATIKVEARNNYGVVTEKILEEKTEIRGRGNSTWGMPKKPYRLKLKNSVEVLGMPKNKHWVLLANYSDKTLMRNELAFEISRRMSFSYTPRMKYVDVKLNGEYIGNYMLGEHIRIDKDRVDVEELKPTDTDITGGYLLEIDEREGEPVSFQTKEAKMIFCVSRPEDIPDNQKTYISNYIQNIENILYGKNNINTVTELPKYLDMKSFIDYLLLNELSKNVDGNLRLSTFVYKNRNDDKLYFGPVWDYDISFGNVNYGDCEKTSGWYARAYAPWYQHFFAHPEFDLMVKNRWKELRKGVLSDMDPYIDHMAKKMQNSQKKNFERWNILNEYVWPNAVVTGSYSGEISYLKTWLKNRITWMDGQLK